MCVAHNRDRRAVLIRFKWGADYSKLPPSPPVDEVFLLDPLIATGGTACAALAMIADWGIPISKIKLLCVLGSEEGLRHVQKDYPELEVCLVHLNALG